MAKKRSDISGDSYRPRRSYVSQDPAKREKQLNNLKYRHNTKPLVVDGELKSYGSPQQFINDPVGFIEKYFYIPETRKPMRLLPHQKEILGDLFLSLHRPNLAVLGQPKKTGKSGFAAAICLWFLMTKPAAEVYLLASSAGQTQLVAFDKIVKAIRMNTVLRDVCKVKADRIEYQESFIQILAPNSSVAGVNPSLIVAEELWSWTTNEHRRAWDELTNTPTRDENLIFVTSYAGYTEDEDSILWKLYKHGIDQQEGREHKDERFWFRWYGKELYEHIPWVKPGYIDQQQRRLRENAFLRLHCNVWAAGEEAYIDPVVLDACTNHDYKRGLIFKPPVCVGIDIGLKHDTSAVVIVGMIDNQTAAVIDHRCFVPKEGKTLDLERTVEAVMQGYAKKYNIMAVYYDPFQFARSAKTLQDSGLPMREYAQTVANTVAMSEALSGMINNQTMMFYNDSEFRQHLLNARAKDTQRGWRIVKHRQGEKIDLTVALAMAVKAVQDVLMLGTQGLFYV